MKLKGILKSFAKGAKYAGLSLGAAALAGVNGVVPGFIVDVLTTSGVPEAFAVIVGGYGTPFLAGVVSVALQQVIKHRDEVVNPQPPA